jgi:hypothetical protein
MFGKGFFVDLVAGEHSKSDLVSQKIKEDDSKGSSYVCNGQHLRLGFEKRSLELGLVLKGK